MNLVAVAFTQIKKGVTDMTVWDFVFISDFGTQKVSIRNRQKFCYFEGEVSEFLKATTKLMKQVREMPVLSFSTTVSHGEAWVVLTVAD